MLHSCQKSKIVTQTDIFFICSTPRGVSMVLHTQKNKSHKCHVVARNPKCVTQTDIFFICSTPRGVSMVLHTQKNKSHKCHIVARNPKCVTQTDIFFICSTPMGVSMVLCTEKKKFPWFDNFYSKTFFMCLSTYLEEIL